MDYNKLSRNFKNEPLQKGEIPLINDLKYLFIELNLSRNEVKEIMGRNVDKYIKQFNLVKTKEQRSESRRQTNLKKYGCINVSQNKNIQNKKKSTCLERYGVDNPSKDKLIRQKQKDTCLERYGVENPTSCASIREKQIQTCIQKYGVENPFKSKHIQQNCRQTMMQRYGVDNPQKSKEISNRTKETRLKKYNSESIFGSDYFKDKVRNTFLQRYGVTNPMYIEEVRDKVSNSQKEFGNQKGYDTKRKNNSFNKSIPEERCYKKLVKRFPDILRQYRSEEYPFACDFYIPSLDLYIECNFSWTHGEEPFDVNNNDHLNLLKIWQEKSLTSNYFKNAIYSWTDLDVRKQKIAKENNLNYLTFYKEKDFNTWFEGL